LSKRKSEYKGNFLLKKFPDVKEEFT